MDLCLIHQNDYPGSHNDARQNKTTTTKMEKRKTTYPVTLSKVIHVSQVKSSQVIDTPQDPQLVIIIDSQEEGEEEAEEEVEEEEEDEEEL